MNNRRFILKVLNGKFSNLNLFLGMELDLASILYYMDDNYLQFHGLSINMYQGSKGWFFEASYDHGSLKFVELESY